MGTTKRKKETIQKVETHAPTQNSSFSISHVAITSGPLPDAASFASYEKTTPGAGERLLCMAEKEQRHRHECENLAIEMQKKRDESRYNIERRGQWFALIVALFMLGIGALLVYTGHPLCGTFISGGTIIGVVSSFLHNRSSQNKNNIPVQQSHVHPASKQID